MGIATTMLAQAVYQADNTAHLPLWAPTLSEKIDAIGSKERKFGMVHRDPFMDLLQKLLAVESTFFSVESFMIL
jgi:hypothetical protein